MSEVGLYASKFHRNSDALRQFDEAIRHLKRATGDGDSRETVSHLHRLSSVLRPVSLSLQGRLSSSAGIDDRGIVEILHQRHSKDWQAYKKNVIELASRLERGSTSVDSEGLEILNDVADAMDTECANLFKRISGSV